MIYFADSHKIKGSQKIVKNTIRGSHRMNADSRQIMDNNLRVVLKSSVGLLNIKQGEGYVSKRLWSIKKEKYWLAKREDNPNSPHYQVHMQAGSTHYRIAVNVKSQSEPSELLFLVDENFQHPILTRLSDLTSEFTPLTSKPDSGALDFIRGNLFSRLDMRLAAFRPARSGQRSE